MEKQFSVVRLTAKADGKSTTDICEEDLPVPGQGDVLARVHAESLNYPVTCSSAAATSVGGSICTLAALGFTIPSQCPLRGATSLRLETVLLICIRYSLF
jgi:hypothetical protein